MRVSARFVCEIALTLDRRLLLLFVYVVIAGIPGWLKAKCVDRAARILIRRVEAYIHRKLPVGERLTFAIRLVVMNLAEAGERFYTRCRNCT